MPKIHVTTFIAAPCERVFDLSRSINLHLVSAASNKEKAIAGTTTGLINKDESVTWQARHMFKNRLFTSGITEMNRPVYFKDVMLKGDFKSFEHEHHFKAIENGTIMIDIIHFETPYRQLGRLINRLFLHSYLKKLIEKRNAVIREYAETRKWEILLS